jgi:N-methylhydantoinase A
LKVYELEIARVHEFKSGSGLPLRTPVIDMIEIGAGGGSIAHLDARGTAKVGPRSAGADPGPACYDQGGTEPTLTDANLVLGYLDPESFLGGDMSLSIAQAKTALQNRIAEPLDVSLERAAFGVHEIINEDVARAFRIHASERGFDYRNSAMVAFGGSGPLHALGVARKLRIPKVIFPVAAGVMSALGLLASPLAFEVANTRETFVEDLLADEFESQLQALAARAEQPLLEAGLRAADVRVVYHLDMRYHGQGHEITVTLPPSCLMAEAWQQLPQLFRARYAELYTSTHLDTPLVITNWKVEAVGPQPQLQPGYHTTEFERIESPSPVTPYKRRDAWFNDADGWVSTPVYKRYTLYPGVEISGPALVEERESTIVVGAGEHVHVDKFYNLVAELFAAEKVL